MDFPTARELKKLAAACRAAGIKTFECEGYKITLSDYYNPPPSAYKQRQATKGSGVQKTSIQASEIPGDSPNAEELMFYSCGGPPEFGDIPA